MECEIKKKEKRSYCDDDPGPSKDIMHLNSCKIPKLKVSYEGKYNFFLKKWVMTETFLWWWNYLWNNCWREGLK